MESYEAYLSTTVRSCKASTVLYLMITQIYQFWIVFLDLAYQKLDLTI